MTFGTKFAAFALGVLALGAPDCALAWGEPGHELIGSIADQILIDDKQHQGTEAKVKQLLGGYSLALAATWADCVRDVKKAADGTFDYVPGDRTPAVCKEFPDSEHARMIDYVSHNWNQCVYTPTEGCHAAYHFSDIAIQRGSYSDSFVGAPPYDIEHAIAAATAVLEGKPCPAPFQIKDQSVALFLLAHWIGDLHQPLHAGAIYLDSYGKVVDPDQSTDKGQSTKTEGGNLILVGSNNLHSIWDDVPTGWGVTAPGPFITAANSIPPTGVNADTWVTSWANDSIQQAKTAYQGLTFSAAAAKGKWDATLPAGYDRLLQNTQETQIEKAGAHLAQLLVVALPGN